MFHGQLDVKKKLSTKLLTIRLLEHYESFTLICTLEDDVLQKLTENCKLTLNCKR